MPIENKPRHGEQLVEAGSGIASAPFQEYLDSLTILVNTNEKGITEVNQLLQDHIDDKYGHRPYLMNWRGFWERGSYEYLDVVYDQGWTMIANKDTSDRAAPVAINVPLNFLDTTDPGWTEVPATETLTVYGNEYTLNEDGFINAYNVYLPQVGTDIWYSIVTRTTLLTGDLQVLQQNYFKASVPGWAEVTPAVTQGFLATSVIEVLLTCEDRSAGYTTVTAKYDFTALPSDVDISPPLGEAILLTNRGYVTFNKTDADGTVDPLAGVKAGTHIKAAGQFDWLVLQVTDRGNDYRFDIAGDGIPADGTITFTFDIPVTGQSLPYHNNVDYWLAHTPPELSNAQGILWLSGSRTVSSTAYGADVLFQQVALSEDWDIVAISTTAVGVEEGGGEAIGEAPVTGDTYGRKGSDSTWQLVWTRQEAEARYAPLDAFNLHIGDGSIHFTKASISHTQIQDIGTYTHPQIDNHINDAGIHFTVGSISHTQIQDIGINSHTTIDAHLASTSNPHEVLHSQLSDVGANDHHNQVHLLYGPDHSDVDTGSTESIRKGLFYNGSKYGLELRANWRGEWGQQTYEIHDMVRDGQWTMIANKQTTDRAAPNPIGDPFYLLNDADPGWAVQSPLTTFVATGHRYIWGVDGFYLGYKVYLPEVGPDIYYRIVRILTLPNGDEVTEIGAEFQGTSIGWLEIAERQTLVSVGTDLEIRLYHENRASTLLITAAYNYTSSNGDYTPLAGEAHRRNNRTWVRFNKVDANSNPDPLAPVVAGTNIVVDGVSDWTVETVTDAGTYYEYAITGTGNPGNGLVTFEFRVPDANVAQPYVENIDYWLTNPPTAGTITGYTNIGGVETVNDSAYGVDILVQQANISEDWDVVATSSGTVGSGEPATGIPEAPTDGNVYARRGSDSTWQLTYTRTELDNRYVLKSGDRMTGNLFIQIAGAYAQADHPLHIQASSAAMALQPTSDLQSVRWYALPLSGVLGPAAGAISYNLSTQEWVIGEYANPHLRISSTYIQHVRASRFEQPLDLDNDVSIRAQDAAETGYYGILRVSTADALFLNWDTTNFTTYIGNSGQITYIRGSSTQIRKADNLDYISYFADIVVYHKTDHYWFNAEYLHWRNAAETAWCLMIGLDGSDNFTVGWYSNDHENLYLSAGPNYSLVLAGEAYSFYRSDRITLQAQINLARDYWYSNESIYARWSNKGAPNGTVQSLEFGGPDSGGTQRWSYLTVSPTDRYIGISSVGAGGSGIYTYSDVDTSLRFIYSATLGFTVLQPLVNRLIDLGDYLGNHFRYIAGQYLFLSQPTSSGLVGTFNDLPIRSTNGFTYYYGAGDWVSHLQTEGAPTDQRNVQQTSGSLTVARSAHKNRHKCVMNGTGTQNVTVGTGWVYPQEIEVVKQQAGGSVTIINNSGLDITLPDGTVDNAPQMTEPGNFVLYVNSASTGFLLLGRTS